MIAVALIAAAISLQGRAPPPPGSATLGIVTKERALASERDLFERWQRYWLQAELARANGETKMSAAIAKNRALSMNTYAGRGALPRTADTDCMFDYDRAPMYVPLNAWGAVPADRHISSKYNQRQFTCPNWLPPDDYIVATPHGPDERLGIDGALDPDQRVIISRYRRDALEALDVAIRRNPSDSLLIGQRVRLLVDERLFGEALTAARSCDAERAWCNLLAGYVYHTDGEFANAADAFDDAIGMMNDKDRCAWNDISALLDRGGKGQYRHMSCAERDSTSARVWWLADPLWSEPGNDRRTEQFARQMTITLHAALGRDERYDWSMKAGGDALIEMVTRYGWPSYAYAGADGRNRGPFRNASDGIRVYMEPVPIFHGLYLPAPPEARHPPPRVIPGIKPTFEYSLGRVHVVPPWSMIENPFAIKNTDWSVNAPSGDPDITMRWWPQEHYAPAHPLVEIMDQQTANLRRQDTTFLAYATNLARTELNRAPGDSVDASFVVSTGPNDINVAESKRASAFNRLVFAEAVPAAPSVVSVEVMWDSGGKYAGRARFGIAPPPPLSSMQRGELAISEPILLAATANTNSLPNDADAAIPLMLGSTTLTSGTHALGLYWETYGFAAADSVDISVTIQPRSLMGLLRIIGATVGVTSNLNAPVAMSWREPQPGHTALTIPGAVSVQMRSVILNIDALLPGAYSLTISVARPGKGAVRSARDFVIR